MSIVSVHTSPFPLLTLSWYVPLIIIIIAMHCHHHHLLSTDLSKKSYWISHQPELYLPQLIFTKLSFFWDTLYLSRKITFFTWLLAVSKSPLIDVVRNLWDIHQNIHSKHSSKHVFFLLIWNKNTPEWCSNILIHEYIKMCFPHKNLMQKKSGHLCVIFYTCILRGALKTHFRKKLGFWPN